MVLVSKSPPQDFVLGVGAKLGREQKSTCKFSTGTHHTHPGFEAARRIDKQSPRIQKNVWFEVLRNQTKHSQGKF